MGGNQEGKGGVDLQVMSAWVTFEAGFRAIILITLATITLRL